MDNINALLASSRATTDEMNNVLETLFAECSELQEKGRALTVAETAEMRRILDLALATNNNARAIRDDLIHKMVRHEGVRWDAVSQARRDLMKEWHAVGVKNAKRLGLPPPKE